MNRVLIVSPHFPPINAPDMQRVRMSAPFFEACGWRPHVLAVDAAYQDGVREPLLLESLPPNLGVTRVRALPLRWTRRIGVGSVALRALPHLHAAGSRLLSAGSCDLVYFSTTMFPSMTLGRLWKRRFGVPYVIDLQDPWLSTYYETHPGAQRPPKYAISHRLDAILEPWTMREADGIVAVSQAYIDTILRRYPWIDPECCATLPFGAAPRDFDVLSSLDVANPVFRPGDGSLHGVYVGRGGDDMGHALRILFRAMGDCRHRAPQLCARLRMHFVGTDYAGPSRARKTVEPLAIAAGVGEQVSEQTGRIGYFETLQLLRDADLLVVVGSDDAQYTASKIYPYVLARRPMLAILHEQSSAAPILRSLGAAAVVTFRASGDVDVAADQASAALGEILERLPFTPDLDRVQIAPYTAPDLTRRQCDLFDRVLSRQRAN
jgi:hypothetical protein